MLETNLKSEWEDSYSKRDNYLFHPHEEVIRFVSKYIRKRVGLSQFVTLCPVLARTACLTSAVASDAT